METKQESDIEILSLLNDTLQANPNASQRDFAVKSDLSLGMVNSILKRFIEKGWIMTNRLSSRKVCYLLTSEGLHCLAARTKTYVKRTFSVMNKYHSKVEEKVLNLKKNGFKRIFLVESSDIQFLLEYACHFLNIKLKKISLDELNKLDLQSTDFVLLSESVEDSNIVASPKNMSKIVEIFT